MRVYILSYVYDAIETYEWSFMINPKKYKYERKRDMKIGDDKNAWVKHKLQANHNFNFRNSKMLVIHNKKHENIVEFSIIAN